MKRLVIAAPALLLALLLAPPTAARAAAPDPVRALQKQLKAERGVTFTEASRTEFERTGARQRTEGGVQLSPSGPVAAYVISQDESVEVIAYPKVLYLGGSAGAELLPQGKSWVSMKAAKGVTVFPAQISEQTIDVFDPAVLRATLKGERPTRVSGGYRYAGVVTYAELSRAAKAYYALRTEGLSRADLAKRTIRYQLWVDDAGVIRRLRTHEDSAFKSTVDTRYADWGKHLVISPPPADEVIPWEDVKDRRLPWEASLPDGSLAAIR